MPAVATHQLISIGNFDASNKQQIAQIAHHNAQILRQIKGMHPPVTQYHNPFPVFPQANAAKHVMMNGSPPFLHSPVAAHQHSADKHPVSEKYPSTQNLVSSSSNIAQAVTPHLPLKSYVGGKTTFYGKPDLSHLKYFNNIGGSVRGPNPGGFPILSTTSRIPSLR